jgi:hypothetical protein
MFTLHVLLLCKMRKRILAPGYQRLTLDPARHHSLAVQQQLGVMRQGQRIPFEIFPIFDSGTLAHTTSSFSISHSLLLIFENMTFLNPDPPHLCLQAHANFDGAAELKVH